MSIRVPVWHVHSSLWVTQRSLPSGAAGTSGTEQVTQSKRNEFYEEDSIFTNKCIIVINSNEPGMRYYS